MNHKIKTLWLLSGMFAALLIVFPTIHALAGPNNALVYDMARQNTAESPQVFTLTLVPAAAFSSDGYYASDTFFSFFGGYISGNSTDPKYGCVKSGIALPNHVLIEEIYANVFDNDPSLNAYLALWRVNRNSGLVNQMGEMFSSSANTTIQTLYSHNIFERNTHLPEYAYYVTACLPTDVIRLYSIRVWYTTNINLNRSIYIPIMSK